MFRSFVNSSDRWLPTVLPWSRAALRLFCFPYAGGGAFVFREWIGALGDSIEICPIQLPGREARFGEAAFTRLAPLIDALVESLGPHIDRPFALFGHSLGALLAFEFARRLRREGRPGPIHLFAAGCGAPQVARTKPWVHALPNAAFRHELRRLGGTPPEVLDNDELIDLLIPTLRADFSLSETYVYTDGGPLDCPISALGGRDDETVGRDDLHAWCVQTTARFRLDVLPGDHFFLRSARPLLLARVGGILSNAALYRQSVKTG